MLGLQSATFCVFLALYTAVRAGRTYTLRWDAASDPVTPAAQLVYDIYFSATPGGEDFSQPSVDQPAEPGPTPAC